MKNKRIFKTLSALCAALVLMMGLSVTAFAQGTEELPAEDATNDSNVVVEETEDSPALTPEGNAALVDDFGGNKQLITVTTKAGNYFYSAAPLSIMPTASTKVRTNKVRKRPITCSVLLRRFLMRRPLLLCALVFRIFAVQWRLPCCMVEALLCLGI